MENSSRLVANIPSDLKRKLKVYATLHETTVTDLIIDSLEKLLQENDNHEYKSESK